MEFDKTRCYSALNADELRAGDKVIVADTLMGLRENVENNAPVRTIKEILGEDFAERFNVDIDWNSHLAYLMERAENCTNCKYSNPHKNLLYCEDDNIPIYVGGEKLSVCDKYEPKTEPRAEPTYKWVNYRPFRDTDELIKVWDAKYRYAYGLERIDRGLDMPHIWVRDPKRPKCTYLLNGLMGNEVHWGSYIFNMQELFDNFEFLDGSPCGVEE